MFGQEDTEMVDSASLLERVSMRSTEEHKPAEEHLPIEEHMPVEESIPAEEHMMVEGHIAIEEPVSLEYSHQMSETLQAETPKETKSTWKGPTYMWAGESEDIELYKTGGYHPIVIDEVLHERYKVVDKLGYGGYSTVWLCRDLHDARFVAVKIGTSADPTVKNECSTVRRILGSMTSEVQALGLFNPILDEFTIDGPNGHHECYVTDVAHGTVAECGSCQLYPCEVARVLCARLILAVKTLHELGLVHGDIRGRNLLMKVSGGLIQTSIEDFRAAYGDPETFEVRRQDGKPLTDQVPSHYVEPVSLSRDGENFSLQDASGLVLCDFGETFAPALERRLGKTCHTPLQNRAPETFFEPESLFSHPADIWSLGITVWDIISMRPLFTSHWNSNFILSEHLDVLGTEDFLPFWETIWNSSDEKHVTPRRPKDKTYTSEDLRQAFEVHAQEDRRAAGCAFDQAEVEAILHFMKGVLCLNPAKRLNILEVLEDPWVTKWVMPSFHQAPIQAESPSMSKEVQSSPPVDVHHKLAGDAAAIGDEEPAVTTNEPVQTLVLGELEGLSHLPHAEPVVQPHGASSSLARGISDDTAGKGSAEQSLDELGQQHCYSSQEAGIKKDTFDSAVPEILISVEDIGAEADHFAAEPMLTATHEGADEVMSRPSVIDDDADYDFSMAGCIVS